MVNKSAGKNRTNPQKETRGNGELSAVQESAGEIKKVETLNHIAFCRRCGRRLKDEQNIILGYGPICYMKLQHNNNRRLFTI